MPTRADSSGAPFAAFLALRSAKRALDRERGAHSALGVVLLRVRIAEESHQPVAELLQDMAAEARSPPPKPRRDRR